MSKRSLQIGACGEEIAVNFLKKNGYKILVRNYKTKLGEIDIIARDKDALVFIEVKTRTSERLGIPAEAVLRFKQKQISKAALIFLKENSLLHKKARFDIVSVIQPSDSRSRLDLIKNAFELDKTYTY